MATWKLSTELLVEVKATAVVADLVASRQWKANWVLGQTSTELDDHHRVFICEAVLVIVD